MYYFTCIHLDCYWCELVCFISKFLYKFYYVCSDEKIFIITFLKLKRSEYFNKSFTFIQTRQSIDLASSETLFSYSLTV